MAPRLFHVSEDAGIARALAAAGVEVRGLGEFWPLCDAVAGSSLRFSIIRKRNAEPRRS